MLNISTRIENITTLGVWLKAQLQEISEGKNNDLAEAIQKASIQNPWFTKPNVIQSLEAIAGWLNQSTLNNWIKPYFLSDPVQVKKIAVIMAGNIPMVNFHDFLSVLITGHQFIGKLSSNDKVLLPFIANQLITINADWKDQISFTEDRLEEFDAVIATGSDNTSRYFEYYFGKYPHIIRKNRQSIAVLTGKESDAELKALYQDVFQYYGMGCRNISMFLVPQGYNFPHLFDQWEGLPKPTDHNKYLNNYDYYRSFYLVNQQPFYDTGYVSVLENDGPASPVSVLHYKTYTSPVEVINFVNSLQAQLQCIVTIQKMDGLVTVAPGEAQCPGLTDYPDGVDIIQFLLAL